MAGLTRRELRARAVDLWAAYVAAHPGGWTDVALLAFVHDPACPLVTLTGARCACAPAVTLLLEDGTERAVALDAVLASGRPH